MYEINNKMINQIVKDIEMINAEKVEKVLELFEKVIFDNEITLSGLELSLIGERLKRLADVVGN